MSIAVKLSSPLVLEAKKYGKVLSRSTPRQIEHWAKIGKIVEENSDLTYENVKQILLAKEEFERDETSDYIFG